MKPFTLDAVLSYRQRLKDLARNRFHQAKNQQAAVSAKLEQKRAEQQALIGTLSRLQAEGVDIVEHIRYENRINLLKTELVRLEEQLRKKQEIVVRERNHLLQKSKEHRVMEKLKERQDADWRQFLDRKEAAMLDEIAVLYRER